MDEEFEIVNTGSLEDPFALHSSNGAVVGQGFKTQAAQPAQRCERVLESIHM